VLGLRLQTYACVSCQPMYTSVPPLAIAFTVSRRRHQGAREISQRYAAFASRQLRHSWQLGDEKQQPGSAHVLEQQPVLLQLVQVWALVVDAAARQHQGLAVGVTRAQMHHLPTICTRHINVKQRSCYSFMHIYTIKKLPG
jgi:hypothetical protein